MNTKAIITIIVIALIAIGAYFAFAARSASAPTETTTPVTDTAMPESTTTMATNTTAATGALPSSAPQAVTITYRANGFSPANVTVKQGTKVTWINQSSGKMWIASGHHPTHTEYDGTSASQHCANGAPTSATVFDECSTGGSFTFTFGKVGSWDYHNHVSSSEGGVITVTP